MSITTKYNDKELIALCAKGDKGASAELYKRYYKLGLKTVYKYGLDSNLIEDVVQDAFINIFKAIKAGKGPSDYFGSYLAIVIRNIIYALNSEKHISLDPEDLSKVIDSKTIEDIPYNSGVLEAFRSLSEKHRKVVWYKIIEGMSNSEIADVMGISRPALTNLYSRAKLSLQSNYLAILAHEKGCPESCKKFADLMGNYISGILRAGAKREIINHLEICGHCSKIFDEINSTASRFRIIFPFGFLSSFFALKDQVTTFALNIQRVIAINSGGAFLFASFSSFSILQMAGIVINGVPYFPNIQAPVLSSINENLNVDNKSGDVFDQITSGGELLNNPECEAYFDKKSTNEPVLVITNSGLDECAVSISKGNTLLQEEVHVDKKQLFFPAVNEEYSVVMETSKGKNVSEFF